MYRAAQLVITKGLFGFYVRQTNGGNILMEEISILSKIEENVAKVMIGKKEVTRLLLAALAASGHVLLEDVPGTGKT